MFQSKRKHSLSGEFISINNVRRLLLALILHVYTTYNIFIRKMHAH